MGTPFYLLRDICIIKWRINEWTNH